MTNRRSLVAACLSLALVLPACDSTLVTDPEPAPVPAPVAETAISFRPLVGYFVRPASAKGTYVFRTSTEWSTVFDPRNRPPLDFADSLVVAVSYGEINACARGGTFERITRKDGQATATLAPVLVPVPQCMADFPYHTFARVAKADLPADVVVTFVVPGAR